MVVVGSEQVHVEEEATDELIAPEKEFVELSVWKRSKQKQLGLDYLPNPADYNIKVEKMTFRGKTYEGVVELVGEDGRFKIKESSAAKVAKKR